MPEPREHYEYQSVEGRSISVSVFGSGERAVLVMGGVHGDEPDGVEVVRALASKLSEMPHGHLDGTRVVLMPLVNPDGYAAGTRQNARGIDLNRNFPEEQFGTGEQSKQYYGGTSAASEPETRAVMDVVERHSPYLIISLHAPLACVNYNGDCLDIAEVISKATGLPAVGDIGYPTPGSMGTYYGIEGRVPVITLELPRDTVDPQAYANVLLDVTGLHSNL